MRYDHIDLQITSFPLIAYNIITPQIIFSVKPSVGEVSDTSWNRRLNYDQDFEVNRPWYYSTMVTDDDIKVEYTAGERAGIYRFTFLKGQRKTSCFHIVMIQVYTTFQDRERYTGQSLLLTGSTSSRE
jgi:putative alpha-1,2-mannosidase